MTLKGFVTFCHVASCPNAISLTCMVQCSRTFIQPYIVLYGHITVLYSIIWSSIVLYCQIVLYGLI